jgi:cystathionine gamma-synthase
MPQPRSPQTVAAANGIATDSAFRAVAPPVHLSSSYAFGSFGRAGRYDYARSGNPTRDLLADTLAKTWSAGACAR